MYHLEKKEKWIYTDRELDMKVTVPPGWKAVKLETPRLPALPDKEDVKKAIKCPVYGKSIKNLVVEKNAKSACVLVSDATRAVPTAQIMKYVAEDLVSAGIPYDRIYVFVAIGVHREATEMEMRSFLGDLYGRLSIENNTPFDASNLIYLGETSHGTPIWVNRKAYNCDLHIQIGKVEPHEFAGFSGGRKSVLPGVSAEETIVINHRPKMILSENAAIGVLEGNPVHEDMVESAEKFRIDFGVNCIINNRLELSAVFAGDMTRCHLAAIEYIKEYLGVKMKAPDILVTTPGQPLDIDFYQAVKALIALTEVLDKKTKVVLYCGCPEGVNSEDMLRAFRSGERLEQVISYTKENYKIQMDHVLLLSKVLKKNVDIFVCCKNVSDKEIREMFMTPCKTLQDAVDEAVKLTEKEEGEILFYPRPQTGLPVLE